MNALEKPIVTMIDPLAVILPNDVYVNLIEKFHPHVPKVAEVGKFLKEIIPKQREAVIAKTRALTAQCKLVEEAAMGKSI